MATPNIVPRADSEGGLGTASKYWASAYIDTINATLIQSPLVDGDLTLKGDNGSGVMTAYLTLDGSEGLTRFSKNVLHQDNVKGMYGTGLDLQIYHDGTKSVINNITGNLEINNAHNDGDIIFKSDNGEGATTTYFSLDGSEATHDGSATTALYTNWPDKSRISLGTSHDTFMVHSGSNFSMINNIGNMNFISTADDGDIIFQAATGSSAAATYLTLDGGISRAKFSVSTLHPDGVAARYGDGEDLRIYHSGTNSVVENLVGSLILQNGQDNGDIIFQSDDGAGGVATYFSLDGSEAAHDGSATTALYTNWPDKSRISVGTSHDLQISHDGNHSYIQQSNTGNLYIQNGVNDGDIILSSDDGSGGQTAYITLDGGDELVKAGKSLRIPDNGQVLGSGSGEIQLGNTSSGVIKVGGDSDNSTISSAFNNLVLQSTRDQDDVIIKGGTDADVYITLDCGDISTTINTIKVLMPNLPTSDSGLATGQLYNASGTLKIA